MKCSHETPKGSVNLALVSVEFDPAGGEPVISGSLNLRESLGNRPALDLPSRVGVQRPHDEPISGMEQLVTPEIIVEGIQRDADEIGRISVRAVDFQAMKGDGMLSPVVYASSPVVNPVDVGALVCFMNGKKYSKLFTEFVEEHNATLVTSQSAVSVLDGVETPPCELVVLNAAEDLPEGSRLLGVRVANWLENNARTFGAA